jgi:hypothetical protein
MKMLYAAVIVATAAACSSIQPVAVQAGDLCLRCRRPMGDLRLAGELIDRMRAPFPFRTAGCMAKYVKAHADEPPTATFVTDYTTGRLMLADEAWFVPAVVGATEGKRGEADYLAFRSKADAEPFRTGQEPLRTWAQVVAEAGAN